MPTYDYVCTECDHRFEHFQSMTSDPLTECPECKGKVRRLIGSGGALIFKGSGFYETDYKKGRSGNPSKKSSHGAKSEGGESGGSSSSEGGSSGGDSSSSSSEK
jgi:putative FmdB family regulatory protein